MALFKSLRGKRSNLPSAKTDGYAYFCTDDGTFHIDYMDDSGVVQRKQINAKDAETVNGHIIESDVPADAQFTDTTYNPVTESEDGLMTSSDKQKLNSIQSQAWTQIYDSGEITAEVNSISGINITGYKSLMVAIKCVNTTNTTSTRAGAVIFNGNGRDYAFNNIFNNLLKNGTTTSGGFTKFRVVDGFIICETAMRAINAEGMLSDVEGEGFDTLAPISGGIIKCTNELTTMTVSSAAQSASHFYGVGSRVIVWGCKA